MGVLYLHGYLGDTIDYDNWISPKLNYNNIEETLSVINNTIKDNNLDTIVAKSIGCYFALYLYLHNTKINCLNLINPCLKPYEVLKCYDWVTEEYCEELKKINPIVNDKFVYNGSLWLELGDEKISQRQTLNVLFCNDNHIFEDGNHRFTRTKLAFDYISNAFKCYNYNYIDGETND